MTRLNFAYILTYGLAAAALIAVWVMFGTRLLAVVRGPARARNRLRGVLGAAAVAGGGIIWLGSDAGPLTRWSSIGTTAFAASALSLSDVQRSLLGARQWLNTQPLQADDLRGKVILVNFWTYSCINSLRALPYVRAWAEKYKDRGLVVIGVHTPEFAFERDVANVRVATASLGVGYPIAIDSDRGIWRAFNNEAWPAFYFIGADGRVRHQVLGEGGYAQSERLIQTLLEEATGKHVSRDIVNVSGVGPQAAADESDLRSPETYVGFEQGRNFVSPGGVEENAPRLYRIVSALPLNHWSMAGVWTIGGEFATLDNQTGRIAYRFHARDLHLVLGVSSHDHPIRFRVKVDGVSPGSDHGVDVDVDGWGTVREDRMYQLLRQTGPITDRTFEIEFFDAGVRVYVFTFG